MHPRGVCELKYLGKLKKMSVDWENFATTISELHEEVK